MNEKSNLIFNEISAQSTFDLQIQLLGNTRTCSMQGSFQINGKLVI